MSGREVQELFDHLSQRESAEGGTQRFATDVDLAINLVTTEVGLDQAEMVARGTGARSAAAHAEVMRDQRVLRDLGALKQRIGSPGSNNPSNDPLAPTGGGVPTRRTATTTPVSQPQPLSAAQIEKLGDAVRSGVRAANADSIFDFVGAQLRGRTLYLNGFVHDENTREQVANKIAEKLQKAANKGELPGDFIVNYGGLEASSNNMRARDIQEAVVREFYREGFDVRNSDTFVAGVGMASFHNNFGSLSGQPRSFGIKISDGGDVEIHGPSRDRNLVWKVRDAFSPSMRSNFHGGFHRGRRMRHDPFGNFGIRNNFPVMHGSVSFVEIK